MQLGREHLSGTMPLFVARCCRDDCVYPAKMRVPPYRAGFVAYFHQGERGGQDNCPVWRGCAEAHICGNACLRLRASALPVSTSAHASVLPLEATPHCHKCKRQEPRLTSTAHRNPRAADPFAKAKDEAAQEMRMAAQAAEQAVRGTPWRRARLVSVQPSCRRLNRNSSRIPHLSTPGSAEPGVDPRGPKPPPRRQGARRKACLPRFRLFLPHIAPCAAFPRTSPDARFSDRPRRTKRREPAPRRGSRRWRTSTK